MTKPPDEDNFRLRGDELDSGVIGFLFVSLIALVVFFIAVFPADAAALLVVDENGATLQQCALPTDYLPETQALVCRKPVTVFHDGFE